MQCSRVYTDNDGETHFQTVSLDVTRTSSESGLNLSNPFAIENLIFFEAPEDWDYRWHPAPWSQYAVIASGAFEIEVSDGEVRRLEAGDIVLLEDITGKGHVSRALPGSKATGIFIRSAG